MSRKSDSNEWIVLTELRKEEENVIFPQLRAIIVLNDKHSIKGSVTAFRNRS